MLPFSPAQALADLTAWTAAEPDDDPLAPLPPRSAGPRPLLLSSRQIAGLLGVTVGTVRRRIQAGELKAVKAGTTSQSRWSVPVAEVEKLIGRRIDIREELS